MGKPRGKGYNKMGDKQVLQDAVSVEDRYQGQETINEADLYDKVDNWEKDQERDVMAMMKKGRKKPDKGIKEMYALSGTDSDSDLELPKIKKNKKKESQARREAAEEIQMNDEDFLGSDIEDDGKNPDKIGAFGSKRQHFYGGNTGFHMGDGSSDSEYSEGVEEEKEARLIQARQMDRLQEEDFLGAFGVDITADEKKPEDTANTVVEESIAPDISQLNPKQLAKLFKQQSPEFDGIVLDFKQRIEEAAKLAKIIQFADQGLLPKGPVTKFVRTKFQILTNYCTNISAYLMFKAKGTNLKLHPVVGRLVEYKNLLDSLEDFDSVVGPQVDKLLERLGAGEDIQDIVKEEKRRARKKMRKQQQTTLKLLHKKKEPVVEEEDKVERKRKPEKQTLEGLTRDEIMAVELYQSIKRKKGDNEEAADESADGNNENKEETNPMLNNEDDDIDGEFDAEPGKRTITYEMAKNKGLTPKRSKLQRNPRVKHRHKFKQALKQRKGAVREVRGATSRYGGEHSGINARVRKGTKIQ